MKFFRETICWWKRSGIDPSICKSVDVNVSFDERILHRNFTVCVSKRISKGGRCKAISDNALFGYRYAPVIFIKELCQKLLKVSRFFQSHIGAAYISLDRIMVFQSKVRLLMFSPWFLFVLFVIKLHFLMHSLSFCLAWQLKFNWSSNMTPNTLVLFTYLMYCPFICSWGQGQKFVAVGAESR